MIVKNEVANLERCLRSVVDYIDCWVITIPAPPTARRNSSAIFLPGAEFPGSCTALRSTISSKHAMLRLIAPMHHLLSTIIYCWMTRIWSWWSKTATSGKS